MIQDLHWRSKTSIGDPSPPLAIQDLNWRYKTSIGDPRPKLAIQDLDWRSKTSIGDTSPQLAIQDLNWRSKTLIGLCILIQKNQRKRSLPQTPICNFEKVPAPIYNVKQTLMKKMQIPEILVKKNVNISNFFKSRKRSKKSESAKSHALMPYVPSCPERKNSQRIRVGHAPCLVP